MRLDPILVLPAALRDGLWRDVSLDVRDSSRRVSKLWRRTIDAYEHSPTKSREQFILVLVHGEGWWVVALPSLRSRSWRCRGLRVSPEAALVARDGIALICDSTNQFALAIDVRKTLQNSREKIFVEPREPVLNARLHGITIARESDTVVIGGVAPQPCIEDACTKSWIDEDVELCTLDTDTVTLSVARSPCVARLLTNWGARGFAGVAVRGDVYLFGGTPCGTIGETEPPSEATLAWAHRALVFRAGRWSMGRIMPRARAGASAVSVGDHIWVIGGRPISRYDTPDDGRDVLVYDTRSATWQCPASLRIPERRDRVVAHVYTARAGRTAEEDLAPAAISVFVMGGGPPLVCECKLGADWAGATWRAIRSGGDEPWTRADSPEFRTAAFHA